MRLIPGLRRSRWCVQRPGKPCFPDTKTAFLVSARVLVCRANPFCGRSAHTEAGWFAGAGKRVIAYIPEMGEPELMYKLFDWIVGSLEDLVSVLRR